MEITDETFACFFILIFHFKLFISAYPWENWQDNTWPGGQLWPRCYLYRCFSC